MRYNECQDSFEVFDILFSVPQKYNNITQVLLKKVHISYKLVHHALKRRWRVHRPECHYSKLEGTKLSHKSCFLLATF